MFFFAKVVVRRGRWGRNAPIFVFFLATFRTRGGKIMPILMFFFIALTIVGGKKEL
jgi:hypothetical protein